MPKVKTDEHGQYVRTNANVYRPYYSMNSYSMLNTINDGGTIFKDGDEVKLSLISQSPFVKVIGKSTEIWHSHGMYLNPDGTFRKSVHCWIPFKVRQRTCELPEDVRHFFLSGPHHIDHEAVRLQVNHSKPGNALKQWQDRLNELFKKYNKHYTPAE